MFRRLIVLSFLLIGLVGFSFADFSSEIENCSSNWVDNCKNKIYKKYQISKSKACSMKDGFYDFKPIQAIRPNKLLFNDGFYKYNGTLYYSVTLSPLKNADFYNMESYLYSYNCKTKKTLDMNIFQGDNTTHTLRIQGAVNNNIALQTFGDEGGGGLFLFDAKKLLLHNLSDISILTNYSSFEKIAVENIKPIFETTKSKEITLHMGGAQTKVAGGNRNDFWNNNKGELSFLNRGFNIRFFETKNNSIFAWIDVDVLVLDPMKSYGFTLAKIDLINRKIIIP